MVIVMVKNDEVVFKCIGFVVFFDVFCSIFYVEWDILLFFYGVVMCVGGLSLFGYLGLVLEIFYIEWNFIWVNVLVGLFFLVVDNIFVMFVVLLM